MNDSFLFSGLSWYVVLVLLNEIVFKREICIIGKGVTAEYVDTMIDFIHGPMFVIFIAITAAGAVIGGVLGLKIFKKHFAKLQG